MKEMDGFSAIRDLQMDICNGHELNRRSKTFLSNSSDG